MESDAEVEVVAGIGEQDLEDLEERLAQEGVVKVPGLDRHAKGNGRDASLERPSLGRTYSAQVAFNDFSYRIRETQTHLEQRVRMDNSALWRFADNLERKVLRQLGIKKQVLPEVEQLFSEQMRGLAEAANWYTAFGKYASRVYDEFIEYKDEKVNGVFYDAVDRLAVVREGKEKKKGLFEDTGAALGALPRTDRRSRKLSYAHDTLRRQIIELEAEHSELAWTIAMKLEEEPVITAYEQSAGQTMFCTRVYANKIRHISDHCVQAHKLYNLANAGAVGMIEVDNVMRSLTSIVRSTVAETGEALKNMATISSSLGEGFVSSLGQTLDTGRRPAIAVISEMETRYRAIADEVINGKASNGKYLT